LRRVWIGNRIGIGNRDSIMFLIGDCVSYLAFDAASRPKSREAVTKCKVARKDAALQPGWEAFVSTCCLGERR